MTDTPQGAQNPAYRLTVIQLERALARSNIISSNPFGFKPLATPRKQPGFHFSALTSPNLGCEATLSHSFVNLKVQSSQATLIRVAVACVSKLTPTLLSALTSPNLGCTRGAIASTLALRSFAQAFIDLYVRTCDHKQVVSLGEFQRTVGHHIPVSTLDKHHKHTFRQA